MAGKTLQGDPNADALDQVSAKLDQVHASLTRVQGTTGLIITEPKLEELIEAVRILTNEVRRVRDGHTDIVSDGIQV